MHFINKKERNEFRVKRNKIGPENIYDKRLMCGTAGKSVFS